MKVSTQSECTYSFKSEIPIKQQAWKKNEVSSFTQHFIPTAEHGGVVVSMIASTIAAFHIILILFNDAVLTIAYIP
jgi:hypothetical protein